MYNFLCCKDCNKRHIGCHSDCPDYILGKRRNDEEKAQINKIKRSPINGYTHDAKEQARKYRKRAGIK